MKILSVSLQDVKSYDARSPFISFHDGVNAIIGENGSGKSTLCEAVGFALFDHLQPYSQHDFVRDGKKTGKVIVTFESDSDGKQYRVERGVNQSRYEIYEEKTGKKLDLHGKEEVLLWLKDQFGVPENMNIQTLWKSSIGVPQGKFTNDFAETPAHRAELFNPLLEVNVYRDLWDKMRGVTHVLYQQQDRLSDQIIRLEANVDDLNDLNKQAQKLAEQIKTTKKLIENLTAQINEEQKEKKRLEQIEKEIKQQTHQLELQQGKRKEKLSQLHDKQKQFHDAEKAEKQMKTHRQGYNQYIETGKKLDALDQKKAKKEQLNQQFLNLEKKLSSLQQKLSQLKEYVTISESSKNIMDELEPKKQQQEKLERSIAAMDQKELEIKEKKQQLKHIKEKISNLRKRYQEITRHIKNIDDLAPIAKEKTNLEDKKDELLKKQTVLQHQINDHTQAIESLSDHTEPKCPTCSQSLTPNQKKDIITEKKDHITHLNKQLKDIKKKLASLTPKIQHSIKADNEQQRLPDLNHQVTDIQSEADEYKKQKQSLDDSIKCLQSEIAEKKTLTTQLEKLEDPKKKYQEAKIRYQDYKGQEKELKSVNQQIKDIQKRRQKLSENLQQFNGLEETINTLKEKQRTLQSSYETFIQNKNAAEKKTIIKKQVSALEHSVTTIKQTIDTITETLKEKKKQFDSSQYQTLLKTLEDHRGQYIKLEERNKQWSLQKKEKDKLIKEKKQAKLQLKKLKTEKHSLSKDIEFAHFLRETFKQTRPLITEILVQEISKQADRIYRKLRGVASEQLTWTKNYEIIVTESGNNRSFHKLSGGEQMCAALSVRLAILKLLSRMDIVFLDEPTMNLDEQKKENLVSQLQELTGFSQIFVISHDETFESMTEHIITLEKRQGSTQLLRHFQGGF